MRPPRIAILVFFSAASLFLVFRSIGSARRHGPGTSSLSQKSSFRALFSFTSPFSLFPPSAAISLTDDNSTFFPARPAAFGPPLPANGLSGQLWIGSGFSDETLQEGEGEGELGCSDIPGWKDGRLKSAIKAGAQGSADSSSNPLVEAAKTPGMSDLGDNMLAGWGAASRKRPRAQPKPMDDGTDDYLHRALQQARSPYSSEPTGSGMEHADIQSMQESAEITGKIALLSRGGCGFLEKVKWAQRRGAIALIVGDNQKGGPLIQMFARGNVDNVTIPSVFTSWTTAHLLSSLMQPGSSLEDILRGKGNAQLKVRHSSKGGAGNKARILSSSPVGASKAQATEMAGSLQRSAGSTRARRGWISRLLHWRDDQHIPGDNSRPPTSGRLNWGPTDASDGKNNKRSKPSADKKTTDGAKDRRESSGNDFQTEVQSWRDPGIARTTSQDRDSFGRAGATGNVGLAGIDRRGGGGIPATSDEYVSESVRKSIPLEPRRLQSSSSRRGLLSRIFGGDDETYEDTGHGSGMSGGNSETTTSAPAPTAPAGDDPHEGLWVTITPTGSASPFFDTLLVLVISPLITLTVVYALLILRVKIRMRRWRAPKSVIDRLPVRTYHTVPSPRSPSPKAPTPRSSSPTTPLLSSSESQPQSQAGAGTSDEGERVNANNSSQAERTPSRGKNSRGFSSEWRKYMGRQVECVVCLEEYIDGVSRVMSLPCGHEFHAECITPWLTTRRRTCPICKNDVVRSLARGTSSGPQYEPFREDGYESSGESSDAYQERIPSPDGLEDLERGPSWNQSPRQDWHANRNDVWFSALASRFGGSSSFSTRRDGSGADRSR
ncbi:hypothetical protein VTH82DRAFT_7688 [Thermothelomyces myriococcoides]